MDTAINRIRQGFIDFFRENGHKYLPPSKCFIPEDKTLFFVNSGMVQLKDVFLGKKSVETKRLVNSQLSIRMAGKKCDIEEVGDSTHLTSFEMLGSWSIADYGKDLAINLAFRFLIERCNLDPNRMYITYFGGNDIVPADMETKELWKQYVPENRILPGSFKDNFWMMGDYGPCGACTEIHYDLIGDRFVPELVNEDPSVVEIWNNVFMEFNKDKDGYHKLEKLYVDTGMGLERLAMILQNKQNVHQTDAFRYLIGYCQALTNAEYYKDRPDNIVDKSYRIFADHIRTTVVALFDGVVFGSYEREFVLRKVFRRLLTYAYLYLNGGRAESLFERPIVKPMITDILNYFGKKRHDADVIWKQLVDEEKLFIGKIRYVGLFIDNALKKGLAKEEIFMDLHDSKGIPLEILENANSLVFV